MPDRDEEILRNMYARNNECDGAFTSIKFKHDYQKSKFPLLIDEDIAELINQGLIYIHGRDKNFRPIVFLNALKLTQKKWLQDHHLVNLIVLLYSYMDEFMLVEGRIENFILIIDCNDISLFNAPYAMIKSVLADVQGLFKCKVKQIFCLNAPAAFSVLWRTVSFSLDAITIAKT